MQEYSLNEWTWEKKREDETPTENNTDDSDKHT